MKLKKLLFLSSVLFSYSIHAMQTASPNAQVAVDSPATMAVKQLAKDELNIVDTFDAVGDLTGFVMQPIKGGAPVLMYANQGGEYVVYGDLLSPKGDNLSKQYKAEYVQPYVAKKIEGNLVKSHSFAQGSADAKAKMYVVADPNCSACHYFYEAAKPLIEDGSLQVRWILVTFLKEDSPNKAAAIIVSEDPATAMTSNEQEFDNEHEAGGITSLESIPDEIQRQLDDNMAFFSDSGLNSTPTLIFYSGGELQTVRGMPRDLKGFVEKVKPNLTNENGNA